MLVLVLALGQPGHCPAVGEDDGLLVEHLDEDEGLLVRHLDEDADLLLELLDGRDCP